MKFSELYINTKLIEATEKLGFTEATKIQEEVIPQAITGIDIIAQAPTGTGKTCAYGLPILNNIEEDNDNVQVLILSPTRELAMQITNDLKDFSMFMKNIRISTLYGGEYIEKQITSLKKHPQIVVATPGRLMDHLDRKTVKLSNLKVLVLDEADEMLNMGFREDVDSILKSVSYEHQTMLFSATYPKEIAQICEQYLHNPSHIKVESKSLTVDTVAQSYILVREKDKVEVISRLVDLNGYKTVMIFCNTKRAVDDVTSGLLQRGYIVEGLHGDMRQMQRDRVMARFREGLIEILVASDVAARGLDVEDVDAVINYDVPDDDEYYIHRIGRTGRARKNGLAITLVNTNERFRLRSIINYTKANIEKIEVPELSQVLKMRISRIIDNAVKATMNENLNTSKNKKLINKIVTEEILNKSILAEDIISGLILMQMDESQEVEEVKDSSSKSSSRNKDNSRIFINLGKGQGVDKAELIELVCKMSDLASEDIKGMELHDDFSFFETNKGNLEKILNAFVDEKYENRRVIVEEAKERRNSRSEGGSSRGRSHDSYGGGRSRSEGSSRSGRSGSDRSSRSRNSEGGSSRGNYSGSDRSSRSRNSEGSSSRGNYSGSDRSSRSRNSDSGSSRGNYSRSGSSSRSGRSGSDSSRGERSRGNYSRSDRSRSKSDYSRKSREE